MGIVRSAFALAAIIMICACTKGGQVISEGSNLLAKVQLTSVTPQFLSPTGGETVTLEGSGLPTEFTVKIGGKVCTDLRTAGSGTWKCNAPALGTSVKASVEIAAGSLTTVAPSLKLRTALVLGAPNMTENLSFLHGLNTPRSLLQYGGKLWVGDYGNERINYYAAVPSVSYVSPDYVLGQMDIQSKMNANAYRSQWGSFATWQLATDGQHFAAADTGSNRVMIWNSIPASLYTPADVVVGQLSMSDSTANFEGVSARTLNTPSGVAFASGKLIVADRSNHRLLIWNMIPTTNGQPADVVLGQPDMTSATANNGGRSASSLSQPYNVFVTGTKLLVADRANSRILIWNSIPTANKTAADLELGQPNFTSGTANQGGIGAATLQAPQSVWTDGTKLLVADTGNSRILLWDSFPTVNRQAANRVVGQPNFTQNTTAVSNSRVNSPEAVSSDGANLIVADTQNHRVLIWNNWPATDGAAADAVIGQPNFTDSLSRNSNNPRHFTNPTSVVKSAGKLIMADLTRQRILIWNSEPSIDMAAADIVLGQTDFDGYKANQGGSASATSFSSVRSLAAAEGKLFAADSSNNRVLIWNSIPTANTTAADIVLGQPNMTAVTANNGGISASTFSLPSCVATDGTRLVICDYTNNRVLIWNTIPTTSNTAADVVLGQPDFSSNTANNGGRSASTLMQPYGALLSGDKLLVSDFGNNRVLIWNTFPVANQQPADLVIGQTAFDVGVQNAGSDQTVAANGFAGPKGLQVDDGGALYIADVSNNRILKFNSIPTTNGAVPDGAIGQPSTAFNKHMSTGGIQTYEFLIEGTKMYIPDYINSRMLIAPL